MGKMKKSRSSIGLSIAIMIMLCFSPAECKFFGSLTCPAKCGIHCVLANLAYPLCFALCVATCPKKSKNGLQCIRRCGVNKSITINVDARGVVTSVVDSCLQACPDD
ncbi:unnamed protein product [Sphenostylis stenocarpa]|uniref:Thionin-like protein 2 n=1 Tax=Sphenostylis stenocarpa TaxID=92480 RepID=A0AA86W639_9FABA|nr:unnamed protein product [Sphenostylis stenocarpa]